MYNTCNGFLISIEYYYETCNANIATSEDHAPYDMTIELRSI